MAVLGVSKKTKMSDLIKYRLKVTTVDSREMSGQLLAFDKHMNLVLADTEEFRITKKSKRAKVQQSQTASSSTTESQLIEEKRSLGLVILRGETVVSIVIEAPPPTDPSTRLNALATGSGIATPITRNYPNAVGVGNIAANVSLAGPVRSNVPQGFRAPQGFPRPPGFKPPPGFGPRN